MKTCVNSRLVSQLIMRAYFPTLSFSSTPSRLGSMPCSLYHPTIRNGMLFSTMTSHPPITKNSTLLCWTVRLHLEEARQLIHHRPRPLRLLGRTKNSVASCKRCARRFSVRLAHEQKNKRSRSRSLLRISTTLTQGIPLIMAQRIPRTDILPISITLQTFFRMAQIHAGSTSNLVSLAAEADSAMPPRGCLLIHPRLIISTLSIRTNTNPPP
jgi:hypothetical protein